MRIEQTVPVVVKRSLRRSQADTFVTALEAMGARVELRAARLSLPPDRAQSLPAPARESVPADALAERSRSVPSPAHDEQPLPGLGDGPLVPEVRDRAPRRSFGPGSIPPAPNTQPDQDTQDRLRRAAGGLAAITSGAVVLGLGVAFDNSCFQGQAGLIGIAFDGFGLASVLLGLAHVVLVLGFRSAGVLSTSPGFMAIAAGMLLAAGIDQLNAPTAAELDAEIAAEEAAARERALQESEDAASFLRREPLAAFDGMTNESSIELVERMRSYGARRILAVDPVRFAGRSWISEVAIEMPARSVDRASVRQAFWSAVRNVAQAAGYTRDEIMVGSDGDWWFAPVVFD